MGKVGVIMNRSPGFSTVVRAARVRLTVWVLVVGAVGLGQACAGRQHFVRGTVAAVDPTRIEIKHKTGQLVSVALTPRTQYRWDHSPASLDDVGVGARVMVVLDEPPRPFTATEVRILSRPQAKVRRPSSESKRFPGSFNSSKRPSE